MPLPESGSPRSGLRIAAAGDIHCNEANGDSVIEAFSALDGVADLLLLAGDLTGVGAVAEAEIVCAAAAHTSVPVLAVLGNHDWHGGRAAEIAARLREGGIDLLERQA